ncbi:LytR/AlgR family response regulator transcription factor [Pedobacter endophyticus]|uniref:Response regulator n=1 Tax=Pedobacter endophyticus TaxID=2789740 RepID=A0A7S9Q0H3_9SPHI|nr:response regulator [Pedobacter endophyticus]QPH40791.1 response regulator [Pedobacter endophyticus]
MSISCIAIDDDPHALQNLIAYVEELPNLELVETFTEPLKALTKILASGPVDIIFLDVEMPVLSGIELATLLRPKTTHLIFTTAHARYAIDAFKVEADAYLLKPYSMLHFSKTINSLYPTGQKEGKLSLEDSFFYIAVEAGDSVEQIDLSELVSVETIDDEVRFRTMSKSFTCPKSSYINTLKLLKKHPAFIQVSPPVLIGKQHIRGVFGHKVLLFGGISYSVADSHLSAFSSFLNNNQ